jgi:hypothetical protein
MCPNKQRAGEKKKKKNYKKEEKYLIKVKLGM